MKKGTTPAELHRTERQEKERRRFNSMAWMFKQHGPPVASGDAFLDAARAYFSQTQPAGNDEKALNPQGLDEDLSLLDDGEP
mgnify:CR=1 FL=1